MSQIMKAYFFCTFLGHNLYFFSRFFVLFLGDEPVATLLVVPLTTSFFVKELTQDLSQKIFHVIFLLPTKTAV